MRNLFFVFSVLGILLAGCMSEPDFTSKEQKRNISSHPETKFEFYRCNANAECWETLGKDYSCYNYPDPKIYGDYKVCARKPENDNCSYDSDCGATEKCWQNAWEGKGRCIRIKSLELPPGTTTETNRSQEEPPIMLSCESNTDCPNWQYNQYRCKEIFKYGKVCVAVRSGGISGKEPGCTNDRNRNLDAGCLPEDGDFCINDNPYITKCQPTEWCASEQYCVRKR